MPGADDYDDEFQAQADEEQNAPGQPGSADPAQRGGGGDDGAEDEGVVDQDAQPITRGEMRAMLQQFGQQTLQESTSIAQSLVDKQGNRFEKRLAQALQGIPRALKVAKQSGMSAEQLAAYEQNLRQDAFDAALEDDPAEAGAGGQAAQRPPGAAGPGQRLSVEQITERGLALLAQFGVGEDDPEMGLLITDGTPEQYFKSIREAGYRKSLRAQGRAGRSASDDAGGAARARMPAHGAEGRPAGRNRTRNVSDAGTLFEMAEDDLKKTGRV